MSGVDQIMQLADEWYAHGQTSHSGIDEKYAALRAAVEQEIGAKEGYRTLCEQAVERAERAERERDEAIALLKEAREFVVDPELYAYSSRYPIVKSLCARIDAAIDAAMSKGEPA